VWCGRTLEGAALRAWMFRLRCASLNMTMRSGAGVFCPLPSATPTPSPKGEGLKGRRCGWKRSALLLKGAAQAPGSLGCARDDDERGVGAKIDCERCNNIEARMVY